MSAPSSTIHAQADDAAKKKESSYRQILKSTAVIGGSSVIGILIGIGRTKAMAMLLGPAGFGLFGLYGSILDLTQAVAGMGVNSSGVREIAEAVGTGDKERIARTAAVLRKTSFLLGLIAALLLVTLAVPISEITFGSRRRTVAVALLSAAAFFRLVSAGQGALIQGMRRIGDLARIHIWGGVLGSITSVALVYFLREDGVVGSLIAVGAMTIATSWWYSRKIDIERPSISMGQVWAMNSALLKVGVAFMASNVLVMISAYAIRIIVRQSEGMPATGFYQAAWTIGGLYVGLILQAMGADFYPRLTAVVHNHEECNRLVNEQAQVGMLLAGPGVVATMTFAPLVISLLYASNFTAAVGPLRWLCLGIAMRVISFPTGFIIMSKGEQNVIIFCECAWTVVHLGLAWLLVPKFGVDGAGMAFFGSYVFHVALTYMITRRMTGFRWSNHNRITGAVYLSFIATASIVCAYLSPAYAMAAGLLLTVVSAIAAIRVLTLATGVPGLRSLFGRPQ